MTDFCPLGHRCESCGRESPRLQVATRDVLNTTLCLTLCPACASSGRSPQIMLSTAERLVAAHVAHLQRRDEPARVRLRPDVTAGAGGRTPDTAQR